MLLPDARAAIVATCQELSRTGLVVGTAGNVSVRAGDLVAITPSGVRYAELTPELVGVHRLDGAPVEAPLSPTSELPLHLALYADRPEAGAVVHTHSPAATALSALADEVPPVHYYVAMFGGPVAVAPYATYGSPELAGNAVRALRDRTACLLGNHGAVTIGPDLAAARDKSVYLEWLCDVYLRALSAGTPRLLPPAEIAAVAAKLAEYGQRPPENEGLAGAFSFPPAGGLGLLPALAHRAPPPVASLGGVEEEPAAVVARALPEAGGGALAEQLHGRGHRHVPHRRQRARVPAPAKRPVGLLAQGRRPVRTRREAAEAGELRVGAALAVHPVEEEPVEQFARR